MSPRDGKRRGLLAALAAPTLLALAAPAHATPEDDYLNILNTTPGAITVNSFSGPLLIQTGYAMCAELRRGASPDAAAQQPYPGATRGDLLRLESVARQTLCPDTVG
ncbi:DUF732 domain-containing protein [Mycobacterium talmoniae]|uniref:DUF732 domain-containing protein n=1 Tax=Mycobacterium talmoniae TaxID=1858794 RepID=A0A1S1NGH4_9MYCO|nr:MULTISPECIES: DUF732 domain-containing protein [Mycobacterium]OHV01577.1 hypothetical protein BKN37_16840 [Mycobacterium talmoniae]PQM49196.1 hypothetical protein C1Y40_00587 [Mycobacterium talmoniae]